jgi:hypothetical protein
MSTPASPSTSNPAGDDRNLVAVDATTALTFEDKMQLFWKRYQKAVYALCVLILVAIVAKGVLDYMGRKKEVGVQNAYAAAKTNDQLKAFAAAHPSHPLGGLAQIRMADEAYAEGKIADALAGYDKALGALKDGPLAARAKLGRAISKVQSGKAAEGSTELKQLAEDTTQLKGVRSEAAFHLTSLAVDAGNAADAQKMVDLLSQIDPMGAWSQRAMMLRATLPATPAPASAAAAPAASEKKEDAGVQLKLPGAEKK